MTCTSDRLLDNVKWRLETLTTHTDKDGTLKDFVYYDKDKLTGELTSGMTRGFSLDWEGSRPNSDEASVMDMAVQQYDHSLVVRVAYHKNENWLTLQRLILRDRFDIVKLLRDPDTWVGYDGDTSLDLSIGARQMIRDEIVETAQAAYLVQHWLINMIEVE